jgi:hypothetical protein
MPTEKCQRWTCVTADRGDQARFPGLSQVVDGVGQGRNKHSSLTENSDAHIRIICNLFLIPSD